MVAFLRTLGYARDTSLDEVNAENGFILFWGFDICLANSSGNIYVDLNAVSTWNNQPRMRELMIRRPAVR